MSGRFWFYLGSIVIIIGLYSWRLATINALENQIGRIDQTGLQERTDSLKSWANRQEDDRKLISLAKKLKYADSESLRVLIDRAYELNPNSRDITLLASQFHPELKSKVLEIDPLYKQ